ncbi:hypothetical protein QGM61_08415 [Pseudohongiella sp. SYSU M77423]|uniref:hypothetical protein n=1 Tax=Pseudohongiella sp. SYSU M77423 TaxID=3042312 RepID=UPI0024808F93|nr:hypothetical protein [Pseudohongiella sp. SYSU M77423]MDH7943844.1 hypothetical protein [Pseudohongiella sp. SYSU M77423]MEC8861298.1 hypothetical protein [Pseudomonadota bacterium]
MNKFDDILKDPACSFDTPADVLAADEFSKSQKIEILRRWDDDARLLLTAQSEGMKQGKSSAEVLTEIQAALAELGAEVGDT